MKKIIICDKEYEIECNALTYVKYRKMFGRGIFEDIQILQVFLAKQVAMTTAIKEKEPNISEELLISKLSASMMNDIDEFIEAITRLTFIMIYTANNKMTDYESWLKGIERINTNDSWIVEVTEFAVNCFC